MRECVLSFFDNILVFSKTLQEHAEHLRQVFDLLRRDQWKVKRSKCSFGQQRITYLGHVISADGVTTDPTKIKAVTAWPTPTNVKEVRQFLGLARYYRRFVRQFGILARPLFNLLKKGTPFVWTDNTEQSFQILKQGLVIAPVLAQPDFQKQFTVETDTCDTGIGAILQQEGHPIAFMRKALCPKYQGLSTYEKEYLAVITAVDQWRPYLQSAEFIIKTDQHSLVYLQEQRHDSVATAGFHQVVRLAVQDC
uniref:Reverse transcriptase domain-containing protein n=1 Tax=Triticum urartu TaxID=4572 RepID=A0A8R7TPA7_TRIUA